MHAIKPLRGLIATAIALTMTLSAAAAHADASEAAEIAAVSTATVTPLAALARAEQHSSGHAYGMGLEVAPQGTWYEVQMLVRGQPMVARIDPHSGAFLGLAPARGEDRAGAHTLDGRRINLAMAIRAAETTGHGHALEAGPAGHGAAAHWDVDVVGAGGKLEHYRVNADTGAVGPAPRSEWD